MADTIRQPIRSRAIPIVPQPVDPVATHLAPSTLAMTSSPSSAFVPVIASVCHDAPSPALDNQPLAADYSSPSTKVITNDDAPVEHMDTSTTLVDVPPDVSSSPDGPHQPSSNQHATTFFNQPL
ncbi:hypothetical protein V6N12_042006 [Hibiscus sabdariffa]|uniref:Uncharacterized protein n=1 Tax=Hibiscus sabdariffa TaxID=183260 RepID=A0ABR2EDI1_9ROSI